MAFAINFILLFYKVLIKRGRENQALTWAVGRQAQPLTGSQGPCSSPGTRSWAQVPRKVQAEHLELKTPVVVSMGVWVLLEQMPECPVGVSAGNQSWVPRSALPLASPVPLGAGRPLSATPADLVTSLCSHIS